VAARLPGLLRYTISIPLPGEDCPGDGIAELWFADREAMNEAFASPEGLDCQREDRELIGTRHAFLMEEHVIR
jgi:hypothetical protein